MIPFGAGLSTSIAVAKDLGDEDKASWLAASYALTQGAFVLISGRFGCVVGYLIAHFGIREGYRFVVCLQGLDGYGSSVHCAECCCAYRAHVPAGTNEECCNGVASGDGAW